MLMREAAKTYNWHLNFGSSALLWRGGCIIRSAFLDKIKEAFDQNHDLRSLLLAPYFTKALLTAQTGWRKVVATAAEIGIPTPCLSTALAFYDGYRSSQLPANLLQAQRDFFGAHTYERIDRPRGEFLHTNWEE
jgi:6-phosphogluconate dehydrogenase